MTGCSSLSTGTRKPQLSAPLPRAPMPAHVSLRASQCLACHGRWMAQVLASSSNKTRVPESLAKEKSKQGHSARVRRRATQKANQERSLLDAGGCGKRGFRKAAHNSGRHRDSIIPRSEASFEGILNPLPKEKVIPGQSASSTALLESGLGPAAQTLSLPGFFPREPFSSPSSPFSKLNLRILGCRIEGA